MDKEEAKEFAKQLRNLAKDIQDNPKKYGSDVYLSSMKYEDGTKKGEITIKLFDNEFDPQIIN